MLDTVPNLPDVPPLRLLRDIIPPGKGRLGEGDEGKRAYLERVKAGQESGMKSMLRLINKHPGATFCVVGGGPTLQDEVSALRKLAERGAILVAVNKSHDWLLKRGLPCHYAVLLDPKEWVADYISLDLARAKSTRKKAGKLWVEPTYLIASQCHQKTVDKFLPLDNAYMWHAAAGLGEKELMHTEYAGKDWVLVPGASVVGLRAVFIAHGLGASNIHLFGIDGSSKLPTEAEALKIWQALMPDVPPIPYGATLEFLFKLMEKNKKFPEEISTIFKKHHYAYGKPHIDDTWKAFHVKLSSGWERAFMANHHMARASYEFEMAMKDWDTLIRSGKMRPFLVKVHGSPEVSAIGMVAAGMGCHAVQAENDKYGNPPEAKAA